MEENQMRAKTDQVIQRLQDERPQLSPLELDGIKTRIMGRARNQRTKGAVMGGRVVVALLTLGLLGAGAGGVLATSSGSSNGASSAVAQYGHHCPPGKHLVDGKCVKSCPPGSHRDHGKCVKPCPKGTHRNPTTRKCVRTGSGSSRPGGGQRGHHHGTGGSGKGNHHGTGGSGKGNHQGGGGGGPSHHGNGRGFTG